MVSNIIPDMLKKAVVFAALMFALLGLPGVSFAQEVCVTVYGGGVVCGAETHEPVEAGLNDISPAVLGGVLLLTSGVLLYFSKKARKTVSGL